jgi:PAS domain S-box-containing protein
MTTAPLPPDEDARLDELAAYTILDTPPEEQFDDLVALAAHICEAPIALISLIDSDRQWFKARMGLDVSQLDRDSAFCAHAILQSDVFVVPDALLDERFARNPLVISEPKIRFYAGSPLITPNGHALGTLCVFDHVPRQLSAEHSQALRVLSGHIMQLLELRRRNAEIKQLLRRNAELERRVAPASHSASAQAADMRSRLQDAERARRALLGVLEDQKRTEERLRANEALLEEAQALTHVGNWAMNHADGELYWSPEVYRIFGLSPEASSPTYRRFLDAVHEDDRSEVQAAFEKSVAERMPYRIRHRLCRPDGAIRLVEERGTSEYGADGRPRRSVGTVQDITEDQQRELALAESEGRLRLFIEHAPAALAMFDRRMRYLAVSQRWLKDFALAGDVLGRSHYDMLPQCPESWRQAHRRAMAGEVIKVDEDRLERADGSEQWLRWEARPWRHADESVGGIVIFLQDISERVISTRTLRASEARYRSLLELAPFPAVLTRRRDGRLVYANRRAERQFGIAWEEGVDLRAADFYESPEERERFLETLHRDGQVNDMELRMRSGDGRPFWALVSAAIVDFEGEPAVFASINDITERKRAENALREQEEFFRLITENMGDMVTVVDRSGRRLYTSPSYRSLFSPEQSARDVGAFDNVHPEDRDRVRESFQRAIDSASGQRADFRVLPREGDVRYVESQSGVILEPNGRVGQVVTVSRDVTERKKLEQEIQQFNSELEERVRQRTAELAAVNKELETFTYSVSHDLKAPLRGIDGYSRLLLADHHEALDEEGRFFVESIRNGVTRMGQLIEDLLSYSRMERREGQWSRVMLSDLVEAVTRDLPEERLGKARLEVAVGELSIHSDSEGLRLVLRNLLDNALKFSMAQPVPKISVAAREKEGGIELTVSDNGIGFDTRFQDRIFEIFQRLHRAEDYPGTGIGLAIVRKAMQRMGGGVHARSEPGKGATFVLEIPDRQAADSRAAETREALT